LYITSGSELIVLLKAAEVSVGTTNQIIIYDFSGTTAHSENAPFLLIHILHPQALSYHVSFSSYFLSFCEQQQ